MSSMKQYMPKKPIKRGFKVWVRADATNVFVSELQVYVGKVSNKTETGLGRRVVESLTERLNGKNHYVYFDNYFSSIPLLLSLSQNGLYGCGTMNSNRKGFPTQFLPKLKKGLKNRGDSEMLQNHGITVYLWQDTKPVLVINNNTQPTDKTQVNRKKRDGSTISIDCPLAVKLYNKDMGGVDLNDQMRNYYKFHLKSRKFYKYIFFFLFQLSITNAFILTRHFIKLNIRTMKKFREQLAISLIGTYQSRKRSSVSNRNIRPTKRPNILHFPMKGVDKKIHRCYYCSHELKQRRQTRWHCEDCDIYLCYTGRQDDCFYLYHKNL